MSNEHDQLSRLVDYHDHIAAPPVPLTDDLHRGRRRVRRNRGVLAGGVAIGLASMVAAVSLVTGGRSSDPPQPADPPGLTTPLVLPTSQLDVRELGFHVEPVPGVVPNRDWSLAADHQATNVEWAGQGLSVRVYYPATGRPDWELPELDDGPYQEVSVHGVTGDYVEEFSGRGWSAQLMWEFAPGSWATVVGDHFESPPPQAATRKAFLTIAEAVRSGEGATTRLPFRVGTARGPFTLATVDLVAELGLSFQPVDYYGSGWHVSPYGERTLGLFVNGTWCDIEDEGYGAVQPFTYRGHKGCLRVLEGEVLAVVLRVGGVDRAIMNDLNGYEKKDHVADLKQMLAELTVAPLDDPSTWFSLKSAFSG